LKVIHGTNMRNSSRLRSKQRSRRGSTATALPCPHTCCAEIPCDGRHKNRECDTNFFILLLVRHYRLDATALPLVRFAPHSGSRTIFCLAQQTGGKPVGGERVPRARGCVFEERPMMTSREILFAVAAVMTATFVLMVVGKIVF
jgi:hypothetical protein